MKDLQSKIRKYASLAAATLGATAVEASIDTTNVAPDSLLTGFTNFEIDLDGDSINDFNVRRINAGFVDNSNYYGFSDALISPLNSSNQIMTAPMPMFYTGGTAYEQGADTLALFDLIGSSASNFAGGNAFMAKKFEVLQAAAPYGLLFSSDGELWSNESDKYVGLRFVKPNGNTHYGWLKISVANRDITVEEYAYQSVAEVPLMAGDKKEVVTDTAQNVVISDNGFYGEAGDIQVSFDSLPNEALIKDYRVILVKASKADTFSLDMAKAMPVSSMTKITPTGSSIVTNLNNSMLDSDGDLIGPNIAYKAFVFTAPDGTTSTIAALSAPSNELTLDINVASRARNLLLSDIGSNGNGLDLQLTFDTATVQASVSEYRAIIVKNSKATNFNVDSAVTAIDSNRYLSIAPDTLESITVNFDSSSVDCDGDLVESGVLYNVFIYSVPDSVIAGLPSLSDSSNAVSLGLYAPDPVIEIDGLDFGEKGNGEDLYVQFKEPVNAAHIDSYKVVVVKEELADTFSLEDAKSVIAQGEDYFLSWEPEDAIEGVGFNFFTGLFNANSKDSDGDLIEDYVDYKVFAVCYGDPDALGKDTISAASESFRLVAYITDNAYDVAATDTSDNGNGTDLSVTFTTAEFDNVTDGYALVAVKQANAASWSLAAAYAAIGQGYYKPVAGGESNLVVNETFDADSKDSDGDLIVENQLYNVFVVSFPDSVQTSVMNTSEASNNVMLVNTVGVLEYEHSQINFVKTGNSIAVETDEMVNIKIVDMSGKIVVAGSTNYQKRFNISQLPQGIYIMTAFDEKGTRKSYKFMR